MLRYSVSLTSIVAKKLEESLISDKDRSSSFSRMTYWVSSKFDHSLRYTGKRKSTDFRWHFFLLLLTIKDDFRAINWVKEYPFPNIALEELKSLLGTC
jgi:hypothetical protein